MLRQIPSVSELLDSPEVKELWERFGEGILKSELRLALEEVRTKIRSGRSKAVPDAAQMADQLRQRLIRFTSPRGRYAINAAGILLHTGLGRSPLCAEALLALNGMGNYSVLQADLASGKRSLREEKIERMMMELTGCEAATVVNNNAAATMLVLNTIAPGKRVILSHGQLIEIGGEFRIPDVMAKSSVILQAVGTTNRTHLHDYERAIDDNTGALLHVHTSNYRVRGFASTPGIRELCELGRKYHLPVIDDLGSGALIPLSSLGLTSEPLVADSVREGTDVMCFSGDKLICGPQAGIICGKRKIIEQIRKNSYARMFRVCKMTIAALEATLLHFINGTYRTALPFYRMLLTPIETLELRARTLTRLISDLKSLSAEIIDDVSYVGSGSLPDEGIPTKVVRIRLDKTLSGIRGVEELSVRLRMGVPSVFGRVKEDAFYFDMRTLFEGEEQEIAESLRSLLKDVHS
ncbi:MAG: L-seryl-tRNA(Sec) selenium transferase [Deltaproteobacteria bacterium]|nr:L-seryl-tRNA(Sec) selenium transferase [Deltaproteobacteria bacterium]